MYVIFPLDELLDPNGTGREQRHLDLNTYSGGSQQQSAGNLPFTPPNHTSPILPQSEVPTQENKKQASSTSHSVNTTHQNSAYPTSPRVQEEQTQLQRHQSLRLSLPTSGDTGSRPKDRNPSSSGGSIKGSSISPPAKARASNRASWSGGPPPGGALDVDKDLLRGGVDTVSDTNKRSAKSEVPRNVLISSEGVLAVKSKHTSDLRRSLVESSVEKYSEAAGHSRAAGAGSRHSSAEVAAVESKSETTEALPQSVSSSGSREGSGTWSSKSKSLAVVTRSQSFVSPITAYRGLGPALKINADTSSVKPPVFVSSLNQALSLKPPGSSLPPRVPGKGGMAFEPSLRDLVHSSFGDVLKAQNAATFKLVKTVSDFAAQLSHLQDKHSEELQRLVENFRKKNSDLRNERPSCPSQMFQAWESLLQEVEVDSQLHSDVAGTFLRQVSRPLIEKTFHRKIQSRKIFTHRESLETVLTKTEDMLKKCRREYSESYQNHCRSQNNSSLASYFDAHNSYVQQLRATNAMVLEYNTSALPALLQELEEVFIDVNSVVLESILHGTEIVALRSQEQARRYGAVSGSCKAAEPRNDVASLVRSLDPPQVPPKPPQHKFATPTLPSPEVAEDGAAPPMDLQPIPPLKNELILDRLAALTSKNRSDGLRKEANDLEKQIASLQESLESLLRTQQRSIESSFYNKANELQEEISMKRFDIRVAQIHLAAVLAQKELFASREGSGSESRERKMSSSSSGSMKSKWMKAFKSLKTGSANSSTASAAGATGGATAVREMERKNGRERLDFPVASSFENAHIFQEYTYKKITACDICHQILRGHSRQGVKCRMCKVNAHFECQDRAPRCQPKSKLLRRQRSTSEIETKNMEPEEEPEASLIASQPGRRTREPPSPTTAIPPPVLLGMAGGAKGKTATPSPPIANHAERHGI